jgi:transcriptional regulator with XRE-family HTH domain
MSTSLTTSLFKPIDTNKVPQGTLAYFRARLKHRIFSLIIKEFKKSGLSQADLARRLDKEPAQLSRLFSGPGNLTIETVSDILFAINGRELSVSSSDPFAAQNIAVPKAVADVRAAFIAMYPQPWASDKGGISPAIEANIRRCSGAPIPAPAIPRLAA